MVARVTHYRIRPSKIKEFTSIVDSLVPAMDKLHGFRVLLMLRGETEDSREAMAISVWDTQEDLRNGDNNEFYYHVIARLLTCCETFSPMHQQQVLLAKFPGQQAKSESSASS